MDAKKKSASRLEGKDLITIGIYTVTSLSDLHEDCYYSFWWLVEYSFYYYCYGAFIGCFFVHYINSYSSKAHT